MNFRSLTSSLAGLLAGGSVAAATVDITVDGSAPRVPLSPHLYGLFFEDINYAADGGIYAELVQNRSFEYYSVNGNDALGKDFHPLYAWEKIARDGASCELVTSDTLPINERNKTYLGIEIRKRGEGGAANLGFDGIRVDEGASYDVSLFARFAGWQGDRSIKVALELPDGTDCGSISFADVADRWGKNEATIKATKTADDARLVVTATGKGTIWLDMVSLFPKDTWKGRKGGLRKDLVQALADLHPKFLRFPGGCIAHGHGLDNVYNWKDTLGPIEERKPNWNLWGYHQTYGLGYYEYFLLCEDLGMHPLPVVPVGVSCGFRPPQESVPMDELQTWIQDALDLIEFANGPADSEWGKVRAKMGHPEPFGMEFICLGNEPHDNALFRDRFPPFAEAIRKAYPDLKIIGTSGLGWQIPIYDLMTKEKVFSSDEHYYEDPAWFLANTHRFDNFDRAKPKIFIGEYASKGRTMFNALSEAAYLTGVERNGDMVDMTCYAPLFGNVDHLQWNPDLIYFDKRTVVKTPSYHVQQLFAQNKGDEYLATTVKQTEQGEGERLKGRVGIGTWLTSVEVESVKINGKEIDPSGWEVDSGDFRPEGKHYAQTNASIEGAVSMSREVYGDDGLTYELRIKKTGGSEGFLIAFAGTDRNNTYWWNLGGWGNTDHGLELIRGGGPTQLERVRGSIETGRWYDAKVVLNPGRIRCYLDGNLIHDHEVNPPSVSVATTYDKEAGELVLKLVNPTAEEVTANLTLENIGNVGASAEVILLAGGAGDENSIEAPERVKPQTSSIRFGDEKQLKLPPMSVQFIRVEAK